MTTNRTGAAVALTVARGAAPALIAAAVTVAGSAWGLGLQAEVDALQARLEARLEPPTRSGRGSTTSRRGCRLRRRAGASG